MACPTDVSGHNYVSQYCVLIIAHDNSSVSLAAKKIYKIIQNNSKHIKYVKYYCKMICRYIRNSDTHGIAGNIILL